MQVFAAGVSADFVFTVQFPLFRFSSGSSPQRTVRDQCCVCCEDPISETCPASCNSTLLVCIRDADHPLTDNSCSLGEIVAPVDPATIMQLSGTFQGPWEVRTTIENYYLYPACCTKSNLPMGVTIHWTGLLDWTTGLDYWTGLLDWTTGLKF